MIHRKDKITNFIRRKDDSPSESSKELTETAFFLSSERFDFEGFVEEDVIVDSIDNANNLFISFKKRPPTLEQALESMGYDKFKELSEGFLKRGADKLKEHTVSGMTSEEIGTIFCYTYEWDKDKYGEIESPYRKLNNSLSVDRNSKTLKKTRSFLFLLLRALRKLPRFVPENRMLYRGIKSRVQTEPDPEFPKRMPYAAGNEKTWWTFTSTSISLEATQNFVGKNKGTLFVMSGETWGYNISMFSGYPDEKEILLEPERRLYITSVSENGTIITVDANILDTPLVLREIIEIGKVAKIKEKKSKGKGVPRGIKVENVTESTVELSWNVVDKAVSYQVSSRKVGNRLFNRNLETTQDTKETKCIVGNLEQGQEYEFRVRCEFKEGFGEWSDKFIETTLAIPKNVVAKSAIWDSISISWDPIKSSMKDLISYRVEMKGESDSDFTEIYNGKETKLTKKGLFADTEHNFRVCVVREGYTGKWSDTVKRKTLEAPEFTESKWKKCPDEVDEKRKYNLRRWNNRFAIKINGNSKYCTIIGNAPIPANKVTLWNIKVLKSRKNDGSGIFVGVAPFDIEQNEDDNYNKCGWYFDCYSSKLCSGPPHKYKDKEYGPRKDQGKYAQTKGAIGVVMDTTKGILSFIVDKEDLGNAYEEINFDRPLVSCVLLKNEGDSVVLSISGKEFSRLIEDAEPVLSEKSLGSLDGVYPQNYTRPTMKQALMEANLSEELAHSIAEDCYNRAHDAKDEGKLFNGFTIDDAAAVTMYTYDLGQDNFKNNPYRLINISLANQDSNDIRRIRGILYLVMTALRKLPRVTGKTLFKGFRRGRDLSADYKTGSIITWNALSSTSPNMDKIKSFLANGSSNGRAEGTLFIIENGWGYDVNPYSMFPDQEEVLLEPGRQFKVTGAISLDLTIINLTMLDTPLLLPDVFGEGRT